MDRSTTRTRIRIVAVALLLLAPAAAPTVAPEAATVGDISQVQVLVVADNAATPAPPAKPPHAPRAPRSSRPSDATPPPGEVPETPVAPEAPEADVAVRAPRAMIVPRGWFGFAMEGAKLVPARDESTVVWRFTSKPVVYQVQPGSPAWRAGIRRGDVVTMMDGVSIMDPMAGRRLASVQPGQAVKWTVIRDGDRLEMVAKAGERPGSTMRVQIIDLERQLKRIQEQTDTDEMRRSIEELQRQVERSRAREVIRLRTDTQPGGFRYAGVIGPAEVEVRGDETVIVNSNDNEMEITIGNTVVKIRVPDATTKRKTGSPK